MKKYFAPTVEFVKLDAKDIIATSGSMGIFDGQTDIYQSREDSDWEIGTGDF